MLGFTPGCVVDRWFRGAAEFHYLMAGLLLEPALVDRGAAGAPHVQRGTGIEVPFFSSHMIPD